MLNHHRPQLLGLRPSLQAQTVVLHLRHLPPLYFVHFVAAAGAAAVFGVLSLSESPIDGLPLIARHNQAAVGHNVRILVAPRRIGPCVDYMGVSC